MLFPPCRAPSEKRWAITTQISKADFHPCKADIRRRLCSIYCVFASLRNQKACRSAAEGQQGATSHRPIASLDGFCLLFKLLDAPLQYGRSLSEFAQRIGLCFSQNTTIRDSLFRRTTAPLAHASNQSCWGPVNGIHCTGCNTSLQVCP